MPENAGVAGAALATGMSQCVGGLLPFIWFLSRLNTSSLRFTRTRLEKRPILHASGNGISEMLTSVSASITGILYNWQLMRHAGEDGVAAYGVVMYTAFVFISVFVGYDTGLLNMTSRAFVICATPFLIMWFNIYVSSFFTALNDGLVSAAISFMRALVLPVVCIIIMPIIWNGSDDLPPNEERGHFLLTERRRRECSEYHRAD